MITNEYLAMYWSRMRQHELLNERMQGQQKEIISEPKRSDIPRAARQIKNANAKATE